ncbi:hypothetical protein ACFL1V_10315 [Pseudomonadota bacterium]
MKKGSACIVVLSALALLLSACSSDGRKPEYYDVSGTEDLEIPEGLDRPTSASALRIQYPVIPLSAMALDPMPPRISNTTSGIDPNSRLNWSAQGMYLLVDDDFESATRRLDLVIKRSGMQRIRVDDQGVYRFDYYQVFDKGETGFFSSMAFWRRNNAEDYSGAYQIYIRPAEKKTRVYVKYADGTDCEPDAAEHLLAVLGSRLG